MKPLNPIHQLMVLAICFAMSDRSLATIIDFEGAVAPGESIGTRLYQESGYTLATAPASLITASKSYIEVIATPIPFIPSNGDVAAGFGPNRNTITTTVTRDNGGLFSLNSLDILPLRYGSWPAPTAFSFHITGVKADLSSFDSAFYDIDSQWHTLSFIGSSSYENLISLSISATSDQPVILAFDNINVSEVPIPASAWLFGSSLLGLTSLRKKKTS
jgi:hypothetical protein